MLAWKRNQIFSKKKTGHILDFGCGTGDFLEFMGRNGWEAYGVEPAAEARKKALEKNTNVVERLEDLPHTKFDIITLWHVAEHIHELDKKIQDLKSKLNTGGCFFIAVPNHQSFDAKKYKEYWAGYDVPRQLWHFSQQAMKQLFAKNGISFVETQPMLLDALYISYLSETYRAKTKSKTIALLQGIWTGIKSNILARKDFNYSSVLYIGRV